MTDSTTRPELRDYVSSRIAEELAKQLSDKARTVPEYELGMIVDEVLKAGNEEIEYNVRRLVKRARKSLAKIHARERAKLLAVPRFSLSFRIQHAMMAASVFLLIFSGVPIKFHDSWVASLAGSLGVVDSLKILHRAAAALMAAASFYHIYWIVFTRDGWRNFVALAPRLQDVKDFIRMVKVLAGKTTERPRFARFNFIEKFDYWAVYWGVIIMLGTGTLMTFNTYFMNGLGPYSMEIAKLIHSDEALLASLALLIWHMYWAHFNPEKFPMNRTFLSGTMTVEEMIHEHPAELEARVRTGEIPLSALREHPEWQAMHPRAHRAGSEGGGV
ncbi:MAG: cytochrome b/b6 domain-containing protein [Candidatus Eisenbacteria bacterium]